MITKPLNLQVHLRRPDARLEAVPFIDICMIAVFFGVLSSGFVVAPGIALSLPTTAVAPQDAAPTAQVLTVMETEGSEVIIFDRGGVLTLEAFEKLLADRNEDFSQEVLLIRADRDVSLQVLTRVWEIAANAGFGRVMIAAEPEEADAGGF